MPDAPAPTAADAWARLDGWLAAHAPALAADLAGPASEAALDALAARTGLALPDDVRALYRGHDGQRSPAPGLFFGLRFLPAAEAADEWGRWADLLRDDPALVADIAVTAEPEGAARAVYASERWLPFAADGAGNGLAVDLDPGPSGTRGQVLSFGADEPVRRVLAPSAAHFLDAVARACTSGRTTIVPDPDAPGGQALRLEGGAGLLDAPGRL